MDLTFDEMRRANYTRHAQGLCGTSNLWELTDWSNAIAGEAGELCNLVKKIKRRLPKDPTLEEARDDLRYELADIVMYVDLLAHQLDIDLSEAVREKFNIVSDRLGSDVRL